VGGTCLALLGAGDRGPCWCGRTVLAGALAEVKRKVLAVLCLFVLCYAAFAIYQGKAKMGAALSLFDWSAFVAACALALGNYVLRFFKWEFYLARLGIRGVPKLDSFLIYISGFVLTVTPGKVGEVFKSAILEERHGVPLAKTAPIVVAERVTDVLGIVILIAIGSAGFSGGLVWAGAGIVLVLVLLAIISSRSLSLGLIAQMNRVPRLKNLAPKFQQAYESLALLVQVKNLLWPTALSCVAWLLECLSLWVILRGFGESTPVAPCMFFYATSTLAGALVPVPGGLGITEGSLLKQMTALGHIDEGVSTAAMILVRFATLWFAVLLGFIALFSLRFRKKAFEALPEPQ
jgi:glycosyltransferase 2 family protein